MSSLTTTSAQSALVNIKKTLRKEIKARIALMTQEQAQRESHEIFTKLSQHELFKQSTHVCLYLPAHQTPKSSLVGLEIDTLPILQHALKQNKKCYVPIIVQGERDMRMVHVKSLEDLNTFVPNKWGIPEPAVETLSSRENILDVFKNEEEEEEGQQQQEQKQPESVRMVIVVPGLGFDATGGRLGRGKGYYDRFLVHLKKEYQEANEKRQENHKHPAFHTIGIAFNCQQVEKVPMSEDDMYIETVLVASKEK